MRNPREAELIQTTKSKSTKTGHETLIIQESGKREFFRFVDGSLDEFDTTSYNGREIRLTDEERYAAREFMGPVLVQK